MALSMKMSWRKSPEALVQRFSEIVPSDPRVERRKMFGYPAAFVGRNMFMGLHQENLILRLPEQLRSEFLSIKGASVFEPMPGRPMREYVVVPEPMLADSSALRVWTGRSLEYAASLPSKKAKTPAKKGKAPSAKKSLRRRG
jgi:TfoX/Sxy family transcriptional regulator of competence genes